ncbi:hypothetical protein RFI_19132 [Reticulomyxa filosa]|uniref:Uncharacterized protein n=1 Tax=Reticulomyxa filosa TaxID=46433 RepID=X6MWY9_RETFI|nr:hypothetical protein RFI_19132 [Reticulomyxa filosa]|eukprot:ETO18156.1 hypothetical protein RFI_19132 [Reticulomyxa filosa]
MGIGGVLLAYFYLGKSVHSYEQKFSAVLGVLLIGNPLLDAVMWCYFKYLPERRVKEKKKQLNRRQAQASNQLPAKSPSSSESYQPLANEKERSDEEEKGDQLDGLEMNRFKNHQKNASTHTEGSEALLAEIAEDQQLILIFFFFWYKHEVKWQMCNDLFFFFFFFHRLRKELGQAEKTISDALRKEVEILN